MNGIRPLSALARRRHPTAPPLNLVFEGDSVTAGAGNSAGNDWPTRFGGLLVAAGITAAVHNTAVSGSTIDGVGGTPSIAARAAADDALLDPARDNYLVLLDGFNDIANGTTDADWLAAVLAWKAARETAGWKVIGCTQWHWVGNIDHLGPVNADTLANFARVIDFAANPEIGSALYRYPFTNDGTHPNDNGSAVMAKVAYSGMRAILGLPRVTVVAGFNPTQGLSGTAVQIDGVGFTGATAVTFNGVPAASFTVVNDSQITAVVPVTTDGPVSVTSPTGSDTSLLGYVYSATPIATITGWGAYGNYPNPDAGDMHDLIDVRGTDLQNATAVYFNSKTNTRIPATAWSSQGAGGFLVYVPTDANLATGPISADCGVNGSPASTTPWVRSSAPPTITGTGHYSDNAPTTTFAAGSFALVNGTHTAQLPVSAAVGGVAVTGGNVGIFDGSVLFVLIPGSLAGAGAVPLTVTTANGTSDPFMITIT